MKWETLVLIGVVGYFAYTYYMQQQAINQQNAVVGYGNVLASTGIGLPII